MPVRVWFTLDDMAHLRIAGPDPLAETLFSVIALRAGAGPAVPDGWRGRTLRRLTPRTRPLTATWPGPGPSLDLLSLAGSCGDLDESLQHLAGASRAQMDVEVEHFARAQGGVQPELAALLHHDRRARGALVEALRAYHDVAVAPLWPELRRAVDAHRARAAGRMAAAGPAEAFRALEWLGVRWRSPVLEVPSSLGDRRTDIHLDGRGLVMQPSLFFGRHAVLFHDPVGSGPDLLVHPLPGLGDPVRSGSAPGLGRLLGSTRARVLAALLDGACSTSDLAARTGISAASASEHATVLREAGLVRTARVGQSVRHEVTELGIDLLGE
jgi:DNA-binding transcriptional ArsR family regulator